MLLLYVTALAHFATQTNDRIATTKLSKFVIMVRAYFELTGSLQRSAELYHIMKSRLK